MGTAALHVSLSGRAAYYARAHWELRLAWPELCRIDMLKSFAHPSSRGHLQIRRPVVALRSLLKFQSELKAHWNILNDQAVIKFLFYLLVSLHLLKFDNDRSLCHEKHFFSPIIDLDVLSKCVLKHNEQINQFNSFAFL